MYEQIIPAINFVNDIFKNKSKRGKITIFPSIQIVPKGFEKVHLIKGNIDSDFLVIYKINILNSGEDKNYLELSIRKEFVGKLRREPFMTIKNPIIKHGFNEFIMSMQSKLQPVENMKKGKHYAFLLDANGKYISRGFEFTSFDCGVGHINYQIKRLPQEKGKIKDIEQEVSELGLFS